MNSIAVDSVTKNTVHIKLSAINMQLMQVFMVSSWNNDNNVRGLTNTKGNGFETGNFVF